MTLNERGVPVLTNYALEHVHECCYIFTRKISASDSYSDSFYRRCFLCRDVNSETYIEAKYNPGHKDNQSKSQRKEEIGKIADSVEEIARKLSLEVPSGFAGTLDYHMKRKKITNEELSHRSGISTVSISGYRNNVSPNIEIERAIALCNSLKLERHYSRDMMKKAGYRGHAEHLYPSGTGGCREGDETEEMKRMEAVEKARIEINGGEKEKPMKQNMFKVV